MNSSLEPTIAIGVLVLIVWVGDVIMRAVNFFRAGKPQQRAVTIAPGMVLEKDCVARHDQVQHEVQRINADIASLRIERREDAEAIHEKINGVAREVSGLATGQTLMNQRMAELTSELRQRRST